MEFRQNRLLRAFIKSDLLRNTSVLISGTLVAQIIPVLLQPVLRRFYVDPEMFGAYSVYLSIVGILLVISSFKYELAIILPKKNTEAVSLFFLTILLNTIFNILVFLIIVIWKGKISEFLNIPVEYSSYLYLVPLGTFLYSLYTSMNYWLVRNKKFLSVSINKFFRRGIEGVSQVSLKFLTPVNGILYGDLLGHSANVISGIYQGKKSGLSLRLFSPAGIKAVLLKYAEYPKFNIVPGLMSACSYLLPALMINKFYSAETLGYFDFSKLLLSVPMALIASSITHVLLQKVSERNNNNQSIRNDLSAIFIFVLFSAILEIIIILVWSEELFSLLFGEEWVKSGTMSKTLVWAFAFNYVVSSFSSIFISLKKIRLLSIWQVFYFLSIISLMYFQFLPIESFLRLYVGIEVMCCTIITILMIYIISGYEQRIKRLNTLKVTE